MSIEKAHSITLYAYVTSPYAMKVHCYLLYKNLPFDVFYVNPLKPSKELPMGRQIPVLKIGEEARGNSSSLGVWLDEKFPNAPQLIPKDKQERQNVYRIDQWISDNLIPTTFYSVYPQCNASLWNNISNTLRLGYCVNQTTTNGLPLGIRFLWPLFIRNARFIRHMIAPVAKHGTAHYCRVNMFSYLEDKLKDQQYLAGTAMPSLADLSAWPSLVVPYKMGLKGFEDFHDYPHILRWVKDIEFLLNSSETAPPLIPENLIVNDL